MRTSHAQPRSCTSMTPNSTDTDLRIGPPKWKRLTGFSIIDGTLRARFDLVQRATSEGQVAKWRRASSQYSSGSKTSFKCGLGKRDATALSRRASEPQGRLSEKPNVGRQEGRISLSWIVSWRLPFFETSNKRNERLVHTEHRAPASVKLNVILGIDLEMGRRLCPLS
jgi:hypothetical protein